MSDKRTIVAVKGLIVNEDKILLLQRSGSDPISPGIWEFAGGSIEFGETLDTALLREIKEETGLFVKIEKLLYADASMIQENRHAVVLCYYCTTAQKQIILSFEHQNYKWATKEEAMALLYPPIANNLRRHDVYRIIFG